MWQENHRGRQAILEKKRASPACPRTAFWNLASSHCSTEVAAEQSPAVAQLCRKSVWPAPGCCSEAVPLPERPSSSRTRVGRKKNAETVSASTQATWRGQKGHLPEGFKVIFVFSKASPAYRQRSGLRRVRPSSVMFGSGVQKYRRPFLNEISQQALGCEISSSEPASSAETRAKGARLCACSSFEIFVRFTDCIP